MILDLTGRGRKIKIQRVLSFKLQFVQLNVSHAGKKKKTMNILVFFMPGSDWRHFNECLAQFKLTKSENFTVCCAQPRHAWP